MFHYYKELCIENMSYFFPSRVLCNTKHALETVQMLVAVVANCQERKEFGVDM